MDRHTGQVCWQSSAPGDGILHGQWSTPSVGEIGGVVQVVSAQGDGWVRGYEADDVLGTLAKQAVEQKMNVVIVSGDKDFYQLVGPHVEEGLELARGQVRLDVVAGRVPRAAAQPVELEDEVMFVAHSCASRPSAT